MKEELDYVMIDGVRCDAWVRTEPAGLRCTICDRGAQAAAAGKGTAVFCENIACMDYERTDKRNVVFIANLARGAELLLAGMLEGKV